MKVNVVSCYCKDVVSTTAATTITTTTMYVCANEVQAKLQETQPDLPWYGLGCSWGWMAMMRVWMSSHKSVSIQFYDFNFFMFLLTLFHIHTDKLFTSSQLVSMLLVT